jgi:hypothetical protein
MSLFPSDRAWGIVARFLRARETAMFEAEARWLRGALDVFPPERLSPLLNLGSSSTAIREVVQPWIEEQLFRPLRIRGVEVIHVDRRRTAGCRCSGRSDQSRRRGPPRGASPWLVAEYRITCAVFEKLQYQRMSTIAVIDRESRA